MTICPCLFDLSLTQYLRRCVGLHCRAGWDTHRSRHAQRARKSPKKIRAQSCHSSSSSSNSNKDRPPHHAANTESTDRRCPQVGLDRGPPPLAPMLRFSNLSDPNHQKKQRRGPPRHLPHRRQDPPPHHPLIDGPALRQWVMVPADQLQSPRSGVPANYPMGIPSEALWPSLSWPPMMGGQMFAQQQQPQQQQQQQMMQQQAQQQQVPPQPPANPQQQQRQQQQQSSGSGGDGGNQSGDQSSWTPKWLAWKSDA